MTFSDVLAFRHACKIFDENRAISDSDWDQILEAGRLAPSSLGLEPWKFELIENKNLREKLRGASWGQAQITSASKLLIIYAKISDLALNSDYIFRMVSRRMDKNQDAHKAYMGGRKFGLRTGWFSAEFGIWLGEGAVLFISDEYDECGGFFGY